MEILFLKQVHHFIKRADAPLKERIKEEILKIKENPRIGEMLSGNLRGLRSHHFHFTKTQYRIAYQVKENLIIVTVAGRENFYRDLEKNV
ncbi:MAG: type II toxin-antitoxin system RelE/ParE family toxin [Candidatus Gracilibacteria bacterium]